MKRYLTHLFFVLGLFIVLMPLRVQATEKFTVDVEIPGAETITLEMKRTDYIGNVKYELQKSMDMDLNKMDLVYEGKILPEVKRFSSGIIPTGATIQMQPSTRWNYDEVKGVDGISFSIARPKEENLKKVYAKEYGMSPDAYNNTAAFLAAINDCASNSYLVIENGVYHFRDMTADIDFNNMENVIIDGNGATFIFDTKYCMKVYGGNGVEFRNLKVNWDWDKIPVGSLVQIEKKHSDTVFDIRFIGVEDVDETIPIGTFWYLDPDDLVIGSYGKYKAYTPGKVGGQYLKKVEKVAGNVLRITHASNDMKRFNEGEYYLLRHFEYSGRVFNTTNYAKNITYDNVSIFGFTGMGWVFSYNTNHFQLINSYLGLDPNGPKERRISTAADAIHILNTGGYFRISNNDLSFTGDDIINVHDDVMDILSIDESRTKITGWSTSGFVQEGDTVKFRNDQLAEFTDYEAKVEAFTTDLEQVDSKGNKYIRIVTLKEPLPESITEDCYLHRSSHSTSNYVISNNYIHEARARAALLNGDYGLFENNYVYRVCSGAIQMRASVWPDRWMEGEGAQHVVARNNTFEECNFGKLEPVVRIDVTVSQKYSTQQIIKDICVENNVFLNCIHTDEQGAIVANNVDNLTISGNAMIGSGEIILSDVVGNTTVQDNNPHTEHQFVNGVCTVCNQVWEKEIDGITYRMNSNVVKRRPVAVTIPDSAKGELAICVVKAQGVQGKDVVLPETITDEMTGQKYILTSIEQGAFADSKAASITIPKTVTEVGENAFGDVGNVVYEKKEEIGNLENPSHSGNSSISGNSTPSGNSSISGNSTPSGNVSDAEKPSNTEKPSNLVDASDAEKPSNTGNVTNQDSMNRKTRMKQKITVSKKIKKTIKIKASKLHNKKIIIKLGAKAKTKLTYKISKYPKKGKKYISVSKKGKVTLKKGCKKGTYKITITAAKSSKYKAAKRVITIKVV